MEAFNLKYLFDEHLQEVPVSSVEMSDFVAVQIDQLRNIQDPTDKVKLLGEVGVSLRILRKLNEAEEYLLEAGKIIASEALPASVSLSQQIRLAHVYQWKKDFKRSNKMFDEIIQICESEKNLGSLVDFAWQHAGKNYFDQGLLEKALSLFKKALELRKARGAQQDQIESSMMAIERVQQLLIGR